MFATVPRAAGSTIVLGGRVVTMQVESATAAIFKLLLVAEKNFRRLNAPELMREIHLGVRFEDGDRVTEASKVAAA